MMQFPLISIKDVSKEYSSRAGGLFFRRTSPNVVFKKINLDIKHRIIVGIGGANGSGKTTLLKLISASCLPTKGKVYIDNIPTDMSGQSVKTRVAANFNNERTFFWRLTGQENVNFFSTLNGIRHNKDYNNNIKNLLSLLDLRDVFNRRVEGYSAAMKEKLGYLLSFLVPKSILVYDDFAKNLDNESLQKLWFYMKEKIQKQWCNAIIISSPKQDLLKALVDKCIFIENGEFKEIDING